MAHKHGTHPNFADIHGDRHYKAQLHGKSPARQAALKKKLGAVKESKSK